MKRYEMIIFIDEMACLDDHWSFEALEASSYSKMSLEAAIKNRKADIEMKK